MEILRRTKIIATLGPASYSEEMLEKMFVAGIDLVRVNFSHGEKENHQQVIKTVRAISKKLNHEIAIMADLQGPKIRIAKFAAGQIELKEHATFILDADLQEPGDEKQVGIDYKQLPQDVYPKDILLLDDGRLELEVLEVTGSKIITRVIVGGTLSNHKGINRQGGGLSADALTEKDKKDIITAAELGVDYFAISFVRHADDIHLARELVQKTGSSAGIIAKIERQEALKVIDEIIAASDAVMVARGDLGVELGYAALPAIQKKIIKHARDLNKAVITATQMMESMIHNSIPTRAEVSDVANAVLDGSDAVMLSAETAVGEHPDKVIESMAKICMAAEQSPVSKTSHHRLEHTFRRVDEAIAMAAMYTANHLNIKAIIALTESGSTPLWMSRIRSGIPIFGLTRHELTQRRMMLYRGVYPLYFDVTQYDRSEMKREAVNILEQKGFIKPGDRVIITKGDIMGIHGGSNAMKIVTVGSVY